MSRRIWLALAIVALVATSFAASVVAAKRSSEDRPKYVTRGLDFLHSRQLDGGGFSTPANTAWAALGAIASGERMGSSAWNVGGENPFDYLQSTDQEAAAASASVDNAPIYYARMIMAYVALGKTGKVGTAGSKGVNLLTLLESYQNTADDAKKGSFSPLVSTTNDAVYTTSWAVLAMNALALETEDRYGWAESWLGQQQVSSGGFPSQPGESADVLTTATAIQALVVAPDGTVGDEVLPAARLYLKESQNTDGGFPVSPGGVTNADATSAAIQAIVALGEKPDASYWRVGINTPVHALGKLQQKAGSYRASKRSATRAVPVTSWALVAMRRKSFSSYPGSIGAAEKAFKFRPKIRSISPKNGAKYKSTRIVLIRATYTDYYPKGTGIKPSACRLYVDSVNRSRAAEIGRYGLRLQLKGVQNGSHTYKIELVDQAGNRKAIERKFTVDVVTPVQPTTRPTYAPTVYPTVYPTTPAKTTTPEPYDTETPSPYDTYTPYPYDSPSPSPSTSGQPVIGSPVPSPSTSASPAGAGASGGGGSAAGFVGGTLLAMLPIGAVASYLLLHRREEILGGASQGTVLTGGGSAWERFKQMLAKSKDLTKPSSRR